MRNAELYSVRYQSMEQLQSTTNGDSDLSGKKLGEIPLSKDAIDLDLRINEGYQSYSAELLRLALLNPDGTFGCLAKAVFSGQRPSENLAIT